MSIQFALRRRGVGERLLWVDKTVIMNVEDRSADRPWRPVEPGERMYTKPLRVFVLEDRPDSNMIIRLMLEDLGCEAVGALTCAEALDRLSAERFDLVMLDIKMYGDAGVLSGGKGTIDGIGICRWIRRESRQPNVPICMVTSSMGTDTVKRAFDEGASGYIVKPFDLQELQAKIDELVVRP